MHCQQSAFCNFYRFVVVRVFYELLEELLIEFYRSNDGTTLLMTSSDGFCSCLSFSPGELGQTHPGPVHSKHYHQSSAAISSSSASTPVSNLTALPPMSRQVSSGNTHSHPSPFTGMRPSSPARSMSASSATTQASAVALPDQNNITLSGPAPSVGTIPSISASSTSTSAVGSSHVAGVPLFTPPQTPMTGQSGPGGSHSAASSVSGIAVLPPKRDSESEKDEPIKGLQQHQQCQKSSHRKRESGSEMVEFGTGTDKSEENHEPSAKKRRIVPTLMNERIKDGEKDEENGAVRDSFSFVTAVSLPSKESKGS